MLTTFTIENLIEDVKIAFKSGALFSALALTFALVSECANIEYTDEWFDENADTDEYMRKQFPYLYKNGKYTHPSGHDKERFIMWYDDWYNAHNCDKSEIEQRKELEKVVSWHTRPESIPSPFLNGELLYQLRCTILHEASSNIEFQSRNKITDEGNKRIVSDKFTLTLDKYNPIGNYGLTSGVAGEDGPSSMNICIGGLIDHLLFYVEMYYRKKGSKHFKSIRIKDYR